MKTLYWNLTSFCINWWICVVLWSVWKRFWPVWSKYHVFNNKTCVVLSANFDVSYYTERVKVWELPFTPWVLFRKIYDENQRNESILHLKSKIKDVGLSSFRLYNKKDHHIENLFEEEYEAFLWLSKNDDIIIQKADKSNTVVLQVILHQKNGRTSCRHQ